VTVTALASLALLSPPGAGATEQGVYEGCSPGTSRATLDRCTERLARFGAAGFGVVLNYSSWYSSEANLEAYADAAKRRGLKLIWPLNGAAWRGAAGDLTKQYPQLGGTCGCDDDAGFIAYAIGLVRARPGTWGWYVGDELAAGEHGAAVALSRRVRQLDPHHPQLLISQETASSRGANLAPFAGLTEYAGADVYPIGTGQAPDAVATVGRGVRDVVDRAGGRVAIVLQAFSLATYPELGRPGAPWPSAAEMRAMRDGALSSARPDLLLWYSAQDILDRSPDPDGLFARLSWAATAPPATRLEATDVAGRAVSASFGTDALGSAECRLDARRWEPCTSPFRASGLGLGRHSVAVRARDLLGQVGRAETAGFAVAPAVIRALRMPRRVLTRRARLRVRRARAARCRVRSACPASGDLLGPPVVGLSLDRPERLVLTFRHRGRRMTLAVDADAGTSRIRIPARVDRRLVEGRWRLRVSGEGVRRTRGFRVMSRRRASSRRSPWASPSRSRRRARRS
jgi:hypothetical protein